MSEDSQVEEKATEAPVIVEPSNDPDFTQTAMPVLSAGYDWIYDPRTGERSKAINYMIPSLLKLKDADGKPRFVKDKPPITPPQGQWKCMLHKDAPNRKHYDEIGLAVCPAGHLSSRYQRDRHMQKKHKTEWGLIQTELMEKTNAEEREARKEDREFQRKLMERIGSTLPEEKPPVYVSKKDKEKQGG